MVACHSDLNGTRLSADGKSVAHLSNGKWSVQRPTLLRRYGKRRLPRALWQIPIAQKARRELHFSPERKWV